MSEWEFVPFCSDRDLNQISTLLNVSVVLAPPQSDVCLFVLQFVLQQVDISLPENRLWWDRYRWDIPVFHLNGRFVMKHRVDVALLDKLLQDTEKQQI